MQPLAAFARKAEQGRLEIPDGCYVNYDLKIIEFLKSLDSAGTQKDYEALRTSLGRRPTLAEFYRSGASVQVMRQQHGSWLELVETIAKRKDVSIGIIDVKSYYIETVGDVAARVRRCLQFAPPERLSFAPDCGLSQTARWAAKQKLANMVAGVKKVRQEMGLP